MIYSNLLWTQGTEILIVLALLFFVSLFFSRKFTYLVLAIFVFQLWFFRNPTRQPVSTVQACDIISPADGKVVNVEDGKMSIFLSPIDVHVNWCPIAGTIKRVTYTKGKFLPAYDPKSSRVNESNAVEITNDQGQSITVRQVAGTLARRIVCWVKEGEVVSRGHKFGMIKLGSRVDIQFPEGTTFHVKKGDRVYGGETIIGSLSWESQKDL